MREISCSDCANPNAKYSQAFVFLGSDKFQCLKLCIAPEIIPDLMYEIPIYIIKKYLTAYMKDHSSIGESQRLSKDTLTDRLERYHTRVFSNIKIQDVEEL